MRQIWKPWRRSLKRRVKSLLKVKLFATHDGNTVVHKVIIDNFIYLLSDTVGFIRKLPTDWWIPSDSTLDGKAVKLPICAGSCCWTFHPGFEEQMGNGE